METLAEELKPFHVDVNAIAPGALATRLVDEVLAAGYAKIAPISAETVRMAREAMEYDVVVVGGGPVALRRVGALTAALASVTVVAPRAVASLEDLAERGRIEMDEAFARLQERAHEGDIGLETQVARVLERIEQKLNGEILAELKALMIAPRT